MPKSLSSAEQTAIAARTVRPVHLLDLDLWNGHVYVTSLPWNFEYDIDGDGSDETFIGVGQLGGVSEVEETTEGKVNSVTVTLAGVKSSDVSMALTDIAKSRWRAGTIYRAYLDADGQLVDAPRVRFKGLIDNAPIKLGGKTAQVSVKLVSRMVRWEFGLNSPRFDDADHRSRRPGDTFFSRMAEITKGKEVKWGKS